MSVIQCKNCSKTIPSKNIDLQKVTAKCDSCQTIFDFSKQKSSDYIVRPKIEVPSNFEVSQHSNSLRIVYKWFSIKHLVFFIIPLPLVIFSLEWLYSSIIEAQWLMAFFGLIPLGISVFMSYIAFLIIFNKTYIYVGEDKLFTTHKPIPSPWHSDWELKRSEIQQLYCKANPSKDNSIETYDLYIIDKHQVHTKLLSNIQFSEHALYLEQELERFLGIEDKKIAGELKH